MTEASKEPSVKIQQPLRNGLGILIESVLLAFIIITLLFTVREVNDIHASVKLNLETHQQILKNLEEVRIQKNLLDELLEAFKNVPKSTSESIVKKANKFEVIKAIHIIRYKLKDSHDIKPELNKIITYPDTNYTSMITEFVNKDLSRLKSNQELVTLIKRLRLSQPTTEKPSSYYQKTKSYFSQLVKIKTSEEYKKESLIKQKLMLAQSEIIANDLTSALKNIHSLTINNAYLEELKQSIQIRIKLDNDLHEIISNLVQND